MTVLEMAAAAAVFCHHTLVCLEQGFSALTSHHSHMRVRNHGVARTAYTEESLNLGVWPGIHLGTTPSNSNTQSSPELLACRDRSSCD